MDEETSVFVVNLRQGGDLSGIKKWEGEDGAVFHTVDISYSVHTVDI